MAGEKKIEKSEPVATVLKSDLINGLSDQKMASLENGIPSELNSSISSPVDATFSIKGYNGSLPQLDDHGYYQANGAHTGMQSENGSLVYYVPGYNPYAPGTIMGVDGQSVGQQQYFSSSGYLQQPVSYGSEAVPFYSWDTTFIEAFQMEQMCLIWVLTCQLPFEGLPPPGRFSSFANQKQGLFPHNGPTSYKPNGRIWSANDRFKSKDKNNRNGDFETSTELTSGPRDQYNLPDFRVDYEVAKFYVIKSYSEDDIHKSIKYGVWASTPNGNKKLDAAFHDAETKKNEAGTTCPIFLFFSVNGSGQFVGLAEMIGPVDFDKDMDFWQVDKWIGFFLVKWHIIKDIPNMQLRHIILESNDNRPVTFSRDTQEIGLKQGLEMLNILKSYTEKMSLLDDFNFYENREKLLHAKRGGKPATLKMEIYNNDDFSKHVKAESAAGTKRSDPTSLINLTKNLSLNAGP
ncbi:hypothetical protein FNV43_RR04397 [Rhamnella rubrinervis]|uniref:YTH domain-containing family protein n=1 Tax=Rhamnella rubrinervis TaxID=2594499 RepID=A0A8K0HK80_9ROSA|nr:hypothetical protein FNV43_RR04397 [Rhamnella rubrinervis]